MFILGPSKGRHFEALQLGPLQILKLFILGHAKGGHFEAIQRGPLQAPAF